MRYEVETQLYEGPLPLLVELARYHLIDVFLIKLVDLTQEYLDRVKAAGIPLNELAEPLPLLGHLLAIKARHLLPVPPVVEEEEGPVSLEELERRLKEYEQFKTVAQLLAELHTLQHQHFTRAPAAADDAGNAAGGSDVAGRADFPLEVGISHLVSAFTKVLKRSTAPVYQVVAEPWTVEQKLEELRMRLVVHRQLRFSELFTAQQSTLELVVTFLALLELMRQRLVRAVQEQLFSEIVIVLRQPPMGAEERPQMSAAGDGAGGSEAGH